MKKRLLHILNIGVAVGLAVAVVVTSKPWETWEFSPRFIGAAVAALAIDVLIVVFWANRHAYVLSATGNDIKPSRLYLIVTFSNAANNLTPAASGEVVRALFLHRNFGVPIDAAGAAIAFERIFMFGLMTLSAAAFGFIAVGAVALSLLTFAGIVLYVLGTPWLLHPLATRVASNQSKSPGRIRRMVRAILTEGLKIWSQTSTTLGTTAWSIGSFAAMGTLFWLAAQLSGVSLSPFETWALVGGATAVGVLSALPFGLGAAELSAVGIAALMDIPTGPVAVSFVLYRVLFTFPMALAGSYAYARLATTDPTLKADDETASTS